MIKRIILRPKASQDSDDQFAYIAEDDLDVAFRFFDATRLINRQCRTKS